MLLFTYLYHLFFLTFLLPYFYTFIRSSFRPTFIPHYFYIFIHSFILHYSYTFKSSHTFIHYLHLSYYYLHLSHYHTHSYFVILPRFPTLIIRYIYTFSYLNLRSPPRFRQKYLLIRLSTVVPIFIYSLRNIHINLRYTYIFVLNFMVLIVFFLYLRVLCIIPILNYVSLFLLSLF